MVAGSDLFYAGFMKALAASMLFAVFTLTPARAWAQAAPAAMKQDMEKYFRGERRGGYGFASVGAASLVAGGWLLQSSSDFYRGMSYPMLGLGAAQLAVGSIVIFTAGPRISKFDAAIDERPKEYRYEEMARMQGVNRTFRILFFTEIAIAAGGLAMGIYGTRSDHDAIAGVGFGLSLQAVLLLAQDTLASRRARRYTRGLANFNIALLPGTYNYGIAYQTGW